MHSWFAPVIWVHVTVAMCSTCWIFNWSGQLFDQIIRIPPFGSEFAVSKHPQYVFVPANSVQMQSIAVDLCYIKKFTSFAFESFARKKNKQITYKATDNDIFRLKIGSELSLNRSWTCIMAENLLMNHMRNVFDRPFETKNMPIYTWKKKVQISSVRSYTYPTRMSFEWLFVEENRKEKKKVTLNRIGE